MNESRKEEIELWVNQHYPQIQYLPCTMPEVLEGEILTIVEDTILATTGVYIIFYRDKGHDSAYREFYHGKWTWKVEGVPHHVSDDDVVAFIERIY
ncbi:MAG: hypothetical protein GY705_18830 [Bacteroidetes bacterium]|nr:hypothetical protein [Bacteroidota bacterium]